MRSTVLTIAESMHTESKALVKLLTTGTNPVQLADMLETFIHLQMQELTHLGSLLTNLPVHGTIATVSDLVTNQQSRHVTDRKSLIDYGTSEGEFPE